jgi:hypothetical protein
MKANRRRRRRGPKLSNGVELQPGNEWLYGYGTSSGRTPSYLKVAELAKSNSATEKHLQRKPVSLARASENGRWDFQDSWSSQPIHA